MSSAERNPLESCPIPENGHINIETSERINYIVETATRDALSRVDSIDAKNRVITGIENAFRPYVEEAAVIAEQITTPEYEEDIAQTSSYLKARQAAVACPDGRIIASQFGAPRTISIARRLGGFPDVRQSTNYQNRNEFVLRDPDLQASMSIDFKERRTQEDDPETIEFVGGHIFSQLPELGCGDMKRRMLLLGRSIKMAMRYGGQEEYYRILGDGFHAFDNMAKTLGGKATTFDCTHDAYSQGVIFGLRDQIGNFDRDLSFRENLINLFVNRKILVTEFLDDYFQERIYKKATQLGITNPLDVGDYRYIARNSIIMGNIAREIAIEEEAGGFSFIPDTIRAGKSEKAIRAAGFLSIWNTVYREIGGIRPGKHTRQEHPERLTRVGPIGADFNSVNIPFILHEPEGPIGERGLRDVEGIHELSHGVSVELGVDLENQARIIVMTGKHDPTIYVNEKVADNEQEKVNSVVGNNAALVRGMFADSVRTGETVVIGSLFEPHTRRISHIVK